MTSRREVVKAGVALAALAAAPSALSRSAAGTRGTPVHDTVLIVADRSLHAAATFAAAAAARRHSVHEFESDVGSLWMNVLELRLRRGPVAIVGITSAATLFCIETLARDYGARATARIGVANAEPSPAADRAVELGFVRLLAADPAAALPPLAPARSTPHAILWRIESQARFRSILTAYAAGPLVRTGSDNHFATRG